MENLKILLIVTFGIIWLIEFYLFGMQRALLLISRYNNIKISEISQYLLPKWYNVILLVKLLKYGLLIIILVKFNWILSVSLLTISFILKTILPIPYNLLYKRFFRKKAEKIKSIDNEAGINLINLLMKSEFLKNNNL